MICEECLKEGRVIPAEALERHGPPLCKEHAKEVRE